MPKAQTDQYVSLADLKELLKQERAASDQAIAELKQSNEKLERALTVKKQGNTEIEQVPTESNHGFGVKHVRYANKRGLLAHWIELTPTSDPNLCDKDTGKLIGDNGRYASIFSRKHPVTVFKAMINAVKQDLEKANNVDLQWPNEDQKCFTRKINDIFAIGFAEMGDPNTPTIR